MSKNKSHHPHEDETNADDHKATELLTHPPYEEVMQKLDEAEQKASDNWDKLLRLQAEMENLKRRSERDVANAHKYGIEKFVAELIPIVDSLELCIANESKNNKSSASVVEGVDMTLKLFYGAMEKFGIKQVFPEGQAFDPEFSQAISMQYDPDTKPGTVLSVLQKGYTLNDRLIRPALVVVSKAEEA